MASIRTSVESRRGCGYRQPGGLYLVSDGIPQPCGRLPIPCVRCPACDSGLKPGRGWTWINGTAWGTSSPCRFEIREGDGQRFPYHGDCGPCPLGQPQVYDIGRAGLLWIGGQFYRTPEDFTSEAIQLGVSRRISAVPRDFKLGKTWVFLGHREACRTPIPDCLTCGGRGLVEILDNGMTPCECARPTPGLFSIFKPTALEYVVTGNESEEILDGKEKRGISLVKVVREQESLPLDPVPA